MAEEFDTVSVDQLDPITLSLEQLIVVASVNGKMYRTSLSNLTAYLSPFIASLGASGYVPVTGTVLPTPSGIGPYFTVVGAQTSTQTTGSSIITTELLNILSYANGTWSLAKAIPLSLSEYAKISNVLTSDYYELKSKNIADKSLIHSGSYVGEAVFNPSVNWISTEVDISGYATGESIIVYGMQAITNTVKRFFFFNGSNYITGSSILSNGAVSQTITKIAGATKLYVNIANTANIGTTPTDNIYSNAFQVKKSTDPATYEAYFKGIDLSKTAGTLPASKVTGVTTATASRLGPLESATSTLLAGYVSYAKFDGTAYITLPATYNLDSDGDYLEFTARTGAGTGFLDWLGMFGDTGTESTFGFYETTKMWLRTNTASAYVKFESGLPILSTFHKIKLLVESATVWALYVDDVKVGTGLKDHLFKINTVGNSYDNGLGTFSKFDLQNFKIHTSTQDLNVTDPYTYSGQVNVKPGYYKTPTAETAVLYSPVYASFEPTGYNGKEKYTIYVKREQDNSYVGVVVGRFYDMSDLVYSDQFRIIGASEYERQQDGTMLLVANNVIADGESECVYMRQPGIADSTNAFNGKADHTGGVHGDEIMQVFTMFLDGVPAPNTAFNLIPCSEAFYVQQSTMHETANTVNGVTTVVSGHPIDFYHLKRTSFGNSGFTTRNRLKAARVFGVLYWYFYIFCNGKVNATKGFDAEFNQATFSGDGTNKLVSSGNRRSNFYNTVTNYASEVIGTLIKFATDNTIFNFFVIDRTLDSKVYGQTPAKTTTVGEIWESEMTVKFTKKSA